MSRGLEMPEIVISAPIEMIQLFVLDIDGCLTMPFQTPDWKALSEIRAIHEASESDPSIPPLTLCTGRPLPYAESVAQWMGIRLPFVFESATLFKWKGNEIISGLPTLSDDAYRGDSYPRDAYSGALNTESGNASKSVSYTQAKPLKTASIRELYSSPLLKPVIELKEWLITELIPSYPGAVLEFTKMMDAGIVSDDTEEIKQIHHEILDHIDRYYTKDGVSVLEVHHTEISVNVLIRGNNKSMGLRLIEKETGISIQEMAYIGDSSGDIPALSIAGYGFAPANATNAVKQVSGVSVQAQESTEAVLNAYKFIVDQNRVKS